MTERLPTRVHRVGDLLHSILGKEVEPVWPTHGMSTYSFETHSGVHKYVVFYYITTRQADMQRELAN